MKSTCTGCGLAKTIVAAGICSACRQNMRAMIAKGEATREEFIEAGMLVPRPYATQRDGMNILRQKIAEHRKTTERVGSDSGRISVDRSQLLAVLAALHVERCDPEYDNRTNAEKNDIADAAYEAMDKIEDQLK